MNTLTSHHEHAHRSWGHVTVRALDWLLLTVALTAGLLLATTWGSLDTRARLAVVVLTVLAAAGHQAIRRGRHS